MEEKKEGNTTKKVAIITGGSRGIGAEIVRMLAKNGYNVILNYNHSSEEAKETASHFSNVEIFKADVAIYEEIKKLINFTINKFGHIDLLVNNAGIDLIKTISDTSYEEFDNIMKTNLYSAFLTSKEVSNYMIKEKKGSIINISSIWGITGASCEVAYSISKAGIDGLTKSLAKELGPSNIRVNSIAPGIINTDMNKSFTESEIEELTKDIPLGKIGTPQDIASCVLFLANHTYITGQVIEINGGWNI